MTQIDLKSLQNQAEKELEQVQSLKVLDEVFNKYVGKKGELNLVLRSLAKLPKEERARIGKTANELKNFLKAKFEQKSREIKGKLRKETEKDDWIDITIPGRKPAPGHLHPLTQIKRETEEIFQTMGFTVVEGPEIETEWYNFDALNFPDDHPAREMQDTLFIKQDNREKLPSGKKFLMRTHTSPVQIHYMEKNNPPLRIIVPGRVFRSEATDASHEINFYQLEGLMADKHISAANFKAVIEEFYRRFFGKQVHIRMRPSYFPFTEPSFEIDLSCLNCLGRGCSACQQSGWMEMMGSGMVHPNVFKNSGLNPKNWQGFAFGMGLDRLAMMKYKINNIRLFYGGDLRFLNQF